MNQRDGVCGWRVVLHPVRNFLYFRIIVCLGTVVALCPTADLSLQVSVRLTKIGKSRGCVIHTMQANEIVDKRFAEPARGCGGKIQSGREMFTKNDAVDRVHEKERGADHGRGVAIKKKFRSRSVDGVKF